MWAPAASRLLEKGPRRVAPEAHRWPSVLQLQPVLPAGAPTPEGWQKGTVFLQVPQELNLLARAR